MSAAKMVADSTQGDLDEPKKKRKRKEHEKKKSKKLKKRDSRKRKGSKKEDDDSDFDLEKELLPISDYIRERQEMTDQLFHCLRGTAIQRYIPDVLKELPLEDLKKRCLEHLEIMSKKRIRRILAGDDPAMISSSGTEESSTEEQEVEQDFCEDVENSVQDDTISDVEDKGSEIDDERGSDDDERLSDENRSEDETVHEPQSSRSASELEEGETVSDTEEEEENTEKLDVEDIAEKSDTEGTAEKSDQGDLDEEREITGESEGEVTSDESGDEIQDESSEVKENADVGEEKSENDSVKKDTLLMLKQDGISSRTDADKEKGDVEGDSRYKSTQEHDTSSACEILKEVDNEDTVEYQVEASKTDSRQEKHTECGTDDCSLEPVDNKHHDDKGAKDIISDTKCIDSEAPGKVIYSKVSKSISESAKSETLNLDYTVPDKDADSGHDQSNDSVKISNHDHSKDLNSVMHEKIDDSEIKKLEDSKSVDGDDSGQKKLKYTDFKQDKEIDSQQNKSEGAKTSNNKEDLNSVSDDNPKHKYPQCPSINVSTEEEDSNDSEVEDAVSLDDEDTSLLGNSSRQFSKSPENTSQIVASSEVNNKKEDSSKASVRSEAGNSESFETIIVQSNSTENSDFKPENKLEKTALEKLPNKESDVLVYSNQPKSFSSKSDTRKVEISLQCVSEISEKENRTKSGMSGTGNVTKTDTRSVIITKPAEEMSNNSSVVKSLEMRLGPAKKTSKETSSKSVILSSTSVTSTSSKSLTERLGLRKSTPTVISKQSTSSKLVAKQSSDVVAISLSSGVSSKSSSLQVVSVQSTSEVVSEPTTSKVGLKPTSSKVVSKPSSSKLDTKQSSGEVISKVSLSKQASKGSTEVVTKQSSSKIVSKSLNKEASTSKAVSKASSKAGSQTSSKDSEGAIAPALTKNQMELLELEMRARAIKAMLAAHEKKEAEMHSQDKQ